MPKRLNASSLRRRRAGQRLREARIYAARYKQRAKRLAEEYKQTCREEKQQERLRTLRTLKRLADQARWNMSRKFVLRSIIEELAVKWRIVRLWDAEQE